MGIPPWTLQLLRRGITDVAKKASETEAVERLKKQASEILQDLPEAAAKGIDAIIRKADSEHQSETSKTRKTTEAIPPVINASGTLLNPLGIGSSLPNVVIELGEKLLSGDLTNQILNTSGFEDRLQRIVPPELKRSLLIANNITSAMLAISLEIQDQTFVIHKNQSDFTIEGVPFIDRLRALGPVLEVDTTDPEFNSSSLPDSMVELIIQDGKTEGRDDRMAGEHPRILIADVCSLTENSHFKIPSCWSILKDEFSWVMMPGNHLCGGHECCLILGPEEQLKRLSSPRKWRAFQTQQITMLLMLLTMEIELKDPDLLPIRSLMNTSLENIKTRSERLSARIGNNDEIRECQIVDSEASISPRGPWTIPSQQIRLRHKHQTPADWNRSLLDDHPSMITSVNGDYLTLDLRWVSPTQDSRIGATLGGKISE